MEQITTSPDDTKYYLPNFIEDEIDLKTGRHSNEKKEGLKAKS